MTDPRHPDTDGERARLEAGLAGRYVLRREIGRGGMATVYLAEDPRHGRAVALKALRPELASAVALAVQAAGERMTQTGLAMGTSEYMSPEQALGDGPVDARSDEYGLACVLYELLAGEPPYTGRSAQAIIAKRLTDPAPSVRRIRPTVPVAVDRALMKALAPVPGDRFPSVSAWAEALASRTPSAPTAPSVAILPFLNLSSDPENEYFADGITEDVIAQVSKVRALKVISRTSVMAFKMHEQSLREIGARLGVGTLLEGSVRRAGDRVRIVAQLIDAETDRHLWAETYDRRLTDIFEIQADVALQIASALKAELTDEESQSIRREPTADLQAYQLYLQGQHRLARFTRDGMLKSIEYFEQALERNPGYAQAYAGIARACVELTSSGAVAPGEASARARHFCAGAGAGSGARGRARGRRIDRLHVGLRLEARGAGVPARAGDQPERCRHPQLLRHHALCTRATGRGGDGPSPRPGAGSHRARAGPVGHAAARGPLRRGPGGNTRTCYVAPSRLRGCYLPLTGHGGSQ